MRLLFTVIIAALLWASSAPGSGLLEIRGDVRTVFEGMTSWDIQSFPGFYYDMDQNVGNERLDLAITGENRVEEPSGLVYTTTKRIKEFKFREWGSYYVIGFLGRPHLAGYDDGENFLEDLKIYEILMDEDSEESFSEESPLKLADGYQLELGEVNESKGTVHLQLSRGGKIIDSQFLPAARVGATMDDKTYAYRKEAAGGPQDPIIIQVHIMNAFRGANKSIAAVDGIFQISESPRSLEIDQQYDTMRVAMVSNDTITMDNKDNTISLNKKMDIALMGDIHLKTADQDDISAERPLRFFICREISRPGTYELRSTVGTLSEWTEYEYSASNFPGFYYDIDEDLGTERLRISASQDAFEEPSGLTYSTDTQISQFELEEWGYYQLLGFLGDAYFAGYSDKTNDWALTYPHLYSESEDDNLLTDQQLTKILLNDDAQKVIKKGESLKLKDGYELLVQGVNQEGQVILELLRDGQSVDTKIIMPSVEGATVADKSYIYRKDLGPSESVVTIAVHFKNAYRDENQAAVTIDGIWQISDQPLSVAQGTVFDKMRIASVSPNGITMDNKDQTITISRSRDTALMGDIYLKTADQDVIDETNPLRYCIYRKVELEPAT
ncbi:MAG: hypothetical protein A4E45_01749 [Methanosaeta sp. PtaB.Bin039]|nr:MAG: hypothetical protein A4E45_01749 [Methanosaeta sp. PtaB.Bin039]OPY47966.1 MAG: hypothetical protein A4E47_00076 [Methanosaeta sp. PtaU1.Bin028]HOT06943.1 S-layer protein domain-containing protein [Methanotrichaceae archaeon]HQF17171.1 S-layer protein domain-containing protein [Methanotrichaceae archaeon]HQI91571.1 S-layer protein domain-containing protein [Methanotrichaceae archaeon]